MENAQFDPRVRVEQQTKTASTTQARSKLEGNKEDVPRAAKKT